MPKCSAHLFWKMFVLAKAMVLDNKTRVLATLESKGFHSQFYFTLCYSGQASSTPRDFIITCHLILSYSCLHISFCSYLIFLPLIWVWLDSSGDYFFFFFSQWLFLMWMLTLSLGVPSTDAYSQCSLVDTILDGAPGRSKQKDRYKSK